MDRLPVELVHLICRAMPQRDLSNFRLVCKNFGDIGAKCIVENLHLMILPKSFENLTNISRYPSLSKWVKSILYEATTLELLEHDEWKDRLPTAPMAPPVPTYPGYPLTDRASRHYRRQIKAWDQNYGPGSQFSEKDLRAAWLSYREILDATDEIEIYYGDFAAMNYVFRSFPNLQELEFTTNREPSETMKAAFAPTLICPGPASEVDEELASALSLRYLTPLLLALIHTGVKLTSFKAELISWHAFHRPPLDVYHYIRPARGPTVEFPWQIDPKELGPAFSQLRHLHLVFESDCGPDLSILAEQEALGQVLQTAKLLQDLRLVFTDSFYSTSFPPELVCLHNLLGNVDWQYLEKLEISTVRVAENYLVDLFKRHSRTLKSLKLRTMYLSYGEWASVFQRMRADLRLTSVAFFDTFLNLDDSDDGEEEEDEFEEDTYLDMSLPLTSTHKNDIPIGERLATYFLGENYRCPLSTKEQRASLVSERERARSLMENGDFSWRVNITKDGLKSC